MPTITAIHGREVLTSSGQPTVEVEVRTKRAVGRSSVPVGDHLGVTQAQPLQDQQERFQGFGVRRAVALINQEIAAALVGQDPTSQQTIDHVLAELDGTTERRRLGANALLAVSLACAQAAAAHHEVSFYRHIRYLAAEAARVAQAEEHTIASQIPTPNQPNLVNPDLIPRLPLPMIGMIAGGTRLGGVLAFREFQAVPIGAESLLEALEWGARIRQRLGECLQRKGYPPMLSAGSGCFGPPLKHPRSALTLLSQAVEEAGLKLGEDIAMSIDVAAGYFYQDEQYLVTDERGRPWQADSAGLIELFTGLVKEYPILALEDPLSGDDWNGWQNLTRQIGRRVWLLAGELFASHHELTWRGLQLGVANGVTVQPQQVATFSDLLRVLAVARLAGYALAVGSPDGETEDDALVDIAVGNGVSLVKFGSLCRGERTVKYNRLLRLNEEFQQRAGLLPRRG